MNLLLDTHALLWWLFDQPGLSVTARNAISDRANSVAVSAASAWEIATKHRIGRLPEAGDVPRRLGAYLETAGFVPMPVSIEHGLRAGRLPGPHRDPFDRVLAAQALTEGVALVTLDPAFRHWAVPTVW